MEFAFPDPIIFSWGPIKVSWYGLMYSIGAIIWYVITAHEFRRMGYPVRPERMPELFVYGVVGALLGARLGYAFLSHLGEMTSQPWNLFAFWKGGMSFHGALIGMICAGLLFVRKHAVSTRAVADATFLAMPLVLMLVKIANFINCESVGRITTLPWGVVFPNEGYVARHPVQIYEAILEGPVLFSLMWGFRKRSKRRGEVFVLFIVGYGLFRFFAEFFREPDPRFGLLLGHFTVGQVLCAMMIVFGLVCLIISRSPEPCPGLPEPLLPDGSSPDSTNGKSRRSG